MSFIIIKTSNLVDVRAKLISDMLMYLSTGSVYLVLHHFKYDFNKIFKRLSSPIPSPSMRSLRQITSSITYLNLNTC